MYNPIVMSDIPKKSMATVMESYSIDLSTAAVVQDVVSVQNYDSLYQEAVFSDGKKSIKPIEEQVAVLKQILMDEVEKQINSEKASKDATGNKKPEVYKFKPDEFWKRQEIKKLEDVVKDTFGFRTVQILPYIEKYRSKTDDFESTQLNCSTYFFDRYPIDGLVSDDGFYDKTHSISIDIRLSLGLIKLLTPAELTAVLLHELGHNIDPAMVTITYAKTNIISKYLTDRKKELSKGEKKLIELKKNKKGFISSTIGSLLVALGIAASFVTAIGLMISAIFKGSKKNNEDADGRLNDSLMTKLKEAIKEDAKSEFGRKDYTEAFADNFSRMYGYGPQLSSALGKMYKKMDEEVRSRFSREKDRQRCIMDMIHNGLKNEHKTDVHRIKALIREYYEDINDPNTSKEVKKQLMDDVKEVEKVLDMYLNDFDAFQNNINRIISEEIDAVSPPKKSDESKDEENKDSGNGKEDEGLSESVIVTYFDESKKAYEKLMKQKESLTTAERAEVKKLFGQSTACSFAKDKDGYFCYTHRCRSDSYPAIADIPQKDVNFVRSTS